MYPELVLPLVQVPPLAAPERCNKKIRIAQYQSVPDLSKTYLSKTYLSWSEFDLKSKKKTYIREICLAAGQVYADKFVGASLSRTDKGHLITTDQTMTLLYRMKYLCTVLRGREDPYTLYTVYKGEDQFV